MRTVRNCSLAACLLVLLGCSPTPAHAGRKPWEGKDWRKWSSRDCKKVLEKSPWVKEDKMLLDGTNQWVRVQFLSALPMRHAMARKLMLQKGYNRLAPQLKRVVDEEIAAILSADTGKIVIRVEYGGLGSMQITDSPVFYDREGNPYGGFSMSWGGGGTLPQTGDAAVIIRPATAPVKSISRIPADKARKKNRTEWQYELILPRHAEGSVVLSLDQDAIVLLLTGKSPIGRPAFVFSKQLSPDMKRESFDADGGRYMFEFRPRQMMYQGKLEF